MDPKKPEITKKIIAEFYRTEAGNEPVRDELIKLGRPIKTEIGSDICYVELNWKVDPPYVHQLRKGGTTEKTIYEVRSAVTDGNKAKQYRTLFFVFRKRMILTHLFLKKTQKTPMSDVTLAWDRMKNWVKEENSNKK